MIKIKCPHCKSQYFIQDIFYPDYLLGKAYIVDRNEDGEIQMYDGIEQELEEEFVCTKCNTAFKVKATMTFETEELPTKTYSNEYRSTIYQDRIELK